MLLSLRKNLTVFTLASLNQNYQYLPIPQNPIRFTIKSSFHGYIIAATT